MDQKLWNRHFTKTMISWVWCWVLLLFNPIIFILILLPVQGKEPEPTLAHVKVALGIRTAVDVACMAVLLSMVSFKTKIWNAVGFGMVAIANGVSFAVASRLDSSEPLLLVTMAEFGFAIIAIVVWYPSQKHVLRQLAEDAQRWGISKLTAKEPKDADREAQLAAIVNSGREPSLIVEQLRDTLEARS